MVSEKNVVKDRMINVIVAVKNRVLSLNKCEL